MGWDGNGVFERTNGTQTGASTWANADAAGNNITTTQHDAHDEDLATGIEECITKDNQSKPSANFLPNADGTLDLGASGTQWRDIHLSRHLNVGGAAYFKGDLSPAQITANQNDYNPTSLSTAVALRLTSDAARTITGLQGGADGRLLLIHNVGSYAITLADESSSSTAANRFALDGDAVLVAGESALIVYDATTSRWRSLLQGFTQAGTGAVATDVRSELRRNAFSVKQFGAVGDGATDDTTAIQNAWTAAKAAGRAVFFPDGSYLVTDTAVTVNYADTKACILGNANRSFIINQAGASKPTIKLNGAQYFYIDGIGCLGLSGYPNEGIRANKDGSSNRVAFGIIRNVIVHSNGVGVRLQDVNTLTIDGLNYWSGAYGGTADSNGNTNAILADGTSAVNSVALRNILVGAVPTIANGGTAIKIDGSSSAAPFQDWSIDAAELEQAGVSTYRSLYANHVAGLRVTNTFAENSNFLLLNSEYADIQVSGGATWSITFGDGTAPNACRRSTVRDSNGDTFTADANNTDIHCYNSNFSVGGYGNSATRSITLGCRTTGSAAVVDKLGADGFKERDRTVAVGEWTTPAFSAGNFAGYGALTVTVASGDVVTQEYTLIGKTMTYNVVLTTVSTGGTADVAIKVKVPGSFTINKLVRVPCIINDAGGGRAMGLAEAIAGDTFVYVYKDATLASNWSNAATDNTAIEFSITFEVQ